MRGRAARKQRFPYLIYTPHLTAGCGGTYGGCCCYWREASACSTWGRRSALRTRTVEEGRWWEVRGGDDVHPPTDVTRRRLTLRPHPKTNLFFSRGNQPDGRVRVWDRVLGTEEAARSARCPRHGAVSSAGGLSTKEPAPAAHTAALSEAMPRGVRVSLAH